MRNYMRKQVVEDGYNPRYYTRDKVITCDHVARFYGACLGTLLTVELYYHTRAISSHYLFFDMIL
jgi:hypothetical protein